ncbi:hypothetical protein EB118_14960 [bacterium]|nr:hypothetical protein [bacterium]NDC96423.1 hypothetical protein [bacterium]NDD86082.1 hypothetical protein [bacterium]NDG31357.1 hypothetical protein [bacterium]
MTEVDADKILVPIIDIMAQGKTFVLSQSKLKYPTGVYRLAILIKIYSLYDSNDLSLEAIYPYIELSTYILNSHTDENAKLLNQVLNDENQLAEILRAGEEQYETLTKYYMRKSSNYEKEMELIFDFYDDLLGVERLTAETIKHLAQNNND